MQNRNDDAIPEKILEEEAEDFKRKQRRRSSVQLPVVNLKGRRLSVLSVGTSDCKFKYVTLLLLACLYYKIAS